MSRSARCVGFSFVMSIAGAPFELAAQGQTLGLLAGMNSSQVRGDEGSSEHRTGFVGGLYGAYGIGGRLSFRPEMLISDKGGKRSSANDVALELRYLQVPLLLQVDLGGTGQVRPRLMAGPSVALRIGCKVSANLVGGTDVTVKCDDAPGGDPVKVSEASAIIGAALDFDRWGFGVRYDHGLTDISDVSARAPAKLRTITAYASVRMGQ